MINTNSEIFRNGLLPQVMVSGNKTDSDKERMLLFYTFLGMYHSINTIKSYKQDLALFYKTLFGFFPNIHEFHVEEEHIVVVINSLKGRALSDRRIARLISCMTMFYAFLVRKRKITSSPFNYISLPKISKDILTQAIDIQDYINILDYCEEIKFKNTRVAILLKLYFTLGYRNHEIGSIRKKDIEIIGSKLFIVFTVKGNKTQKILIEQKLSSLIVYYINKEKFEEADYIFSVKDRTKPMSQSNVWDIFQRLKKKLDIRSEKFSPHSARATVITFLLRTEPIQNVSRFVSHSSVSITALYDKNRLLNEQSVAYQEHLNNLAN